MRMVLLLGVGFASGLIFRFPSFAFCSVLFVALYIPLFGTGQSFRDLLVEAVLALVLLQVGYFLTIVARLLYVRITRRRPTRDA
jgi:hypothetical protein